MFFFGGIREYGRVERCDDTWVASHFVHVNFCPLFPMRSMLHSATGQAREIPLHLTSVVAGYLRTYPFVLLLVGALAPGLSMFARAAMIACASLALLGGFFVVGRLSEDEAARRRVFSDYVGAPIDPTWIKGEGFSGSIPIASSRCRMASFVLLSCSSLLATSWWALHRLCLMTSLPGASS